MPLESIRCTQFQLNPGLLRHSRQLHLNGRFNWRYMGGREWPQSAEHSAADYYTCLSCQHPFKTNEGREWTRANATVKEDDPRWICKHLQCPTNEAPREFVCLLPESSVN